MSENTMRRVEGQPVDPKDLKPNKSRFNLGLGNPFSKLRSPVLAGVPIDIKPKPKQEDPKKKGISSVVTDKPAETGISKRKARKLREQSLREQRKPNRLKTAAKVVAVLGILGGGTYAGSEIYQNVQAQERPAPSGTNVDAVNNFLNNGEIDNTFQVPSTFDPTAKEGIIGPANAVVVTAESDPEAVESKGRTDNDKTTIIPLALVKEDGKTIPTITYSLIESTSSTGGKDMISITDGIQPGDILKSPVKGVIYHSVAARFARDDNMLDHPWFKIETTDKNGNPIILTIRSTAIVSPLIDTPSIEEFKGKEMPKVNIDVGDDIFKFVTVSKDPRNGAQLSITGAGGGPIAIKTKDNKVVFVTNIKEKVSRVFKRLKQALHSKV